MELGIGLSVSMDEGCALFPILVKPGYDAYSNSFYVPVNTKVYG